ALIDRGATVPPTTGGTYASTKPAAPDSKLDVLAALQRTAFTSLCRHRHRLCALTALVSPLPDDFRTLHITSSPVPVLTTRTSVYASFRASLSPRAVQCAKVVNQPYGRRAVSFLWHFPYSHLRLPLATVLLYAVRTFLAHAASDRL